MKISYLERASDYEVRQWLEKELDLTPYQKQKLYDKEIIRFSPFYFYRDSKNKKSSILWRLTILVFPIYYLLAFCFLPINFIFTGKWGYGRDFIDKFHSVWVRKIQGSYGK
jgi:hypothetical protein